MAGILGILGNSGQAGHEPVLQAMLKSMTHDERDRGETVRIGEGGTGLGWVGRDGEESDLRFAWNETGDVGFLFAGMEVSGREQGEFLKGRGHSPGREGAALLVHLYEEFGAGFLPKLNGIFSGVVADLRGPHPVLILFNDRFGLGRVYVHESEGTLYFASEAKAILAAVPSLRASDPASLGEFFSCGCPLENRSLFKGVELLPGGACWSWTPAGRAKRETYFTPAEWEELPVLEPDEFYERLQETFLRIVPSYAGEGDDRALSLTGGLDSRMVLAAMDPDPGSLKCYTFGGMHRDCADVKLGRQVAEACGQPHEVLPLDRGFFREFPRHAQDTVYLTDGAMDVAGAANLHLNQQARKIARVRLTGNYGGEILRGIKGLKSHRVDESVLAPEFRPHVRDAVITLKRHEEVPRPSFVAFKQVPWFHFGMLALEGSQVEVRTPFLDNALVALSFQAPAEFRLNKNLAFRMVAEWDPRLASIPNDRGVVWNPNADLAASRSRIQKFRQEFLPRAEYMYDYGMPGWLARMDRILSPLRLERLFLGHQKFCHFRSWYRSELSDYVREVLLDPRSLDRSYLDRRRVEDVVSSHVRGTANHTLAIHKLLSAELLHRTLVDRN